MATNLNERNESSVTQIKENPVCPIIVDCNSFRLFSRPDINSLHYIVHFCGNQYLQCQVYKTRQSMQKNQSDPPGLASAKSRASPAADKQ
jgi:hypothetical protein